MSTDSCEGLTLTEVCIGKKKSTISSLDTARLGYASTSLNKTGSDIPLHTTFTGIRRFICITGLPSEGGCIQVFCYFGLGGFNYF